MTTQQLNFVSHVETSCGSLLKELQIIWDEVGESDAEKDKMLLQLEQECMEVYRRKVDDANKSRAQLRLAIADSEAELAAICSAMGEMPVHIRQSDQSSKSLKAELKAILPQIEEMRKRKSDRKNQFIEILEEIHSLNNEISGSSGFASNNFVLDETDLSSRKLEEFHRELQALQKEKSERLNQIQDHIYSLYTLCSVLGLDLQLILNEIHPSLGEPESSRNISIETIQQLETAAHRLREIKIQRIQQLQDLATSMLELWNLMDTPVEEQQIFHKVTCNVASSEDEITEPDMLSINFIDRVKEEVSRLEVLKASKMKELILKKKAELEDICRKTHLIPEANGAIDIAIDAMESGAVDATCLLEQIEFQIARAKEEALSRKEVLEKVEKWMSACEEESWLEEYNRDDNRYNAGRGAHLTLRRAEKARVLVNKLPGMVETLASKAIDWENEKGIDFTYDGVRLLSMLEGYTFLRQEKELEHKRQRDQKKLQGQLLTEQEALYGSKPSPMKNHSVKKGSRLSYGGTSNRRLSLGGSMVPAKATPNTRTSKKNEHINQDRLKDDGFAALSSGRRGLDIAGLPMKQHSRNVSTACEIDSPMVRKPFSFISSNDSLNFNMTTKLEELDKKQNEILLKNILTNNIQFNTPSKILPTTEDENRTPQTMAIPVPSTPSTVSIPMQMISTPGISVHSTPPAIPISAKVVTAPSISLEEENKIEYSFEEKRAGFVLPISSHTMNVIQE